ncbi:MAG: MFS transporter [Alphaproteobacteria bacterium]|nr:MFS transporter [Alphaproteobacteria bacterium]
MLAGVWLPYFCFGLTNIGLAPLVEPITRDLGLSHSAMGSIMGVWQLVYIVSSVPCGALLDRLGPGRALFLGTVLIGLSGVMRSYAVDYLTLCLAVAVFGLGGPIISSGAPKVVSLWFRGRERGLAMGIYMTGPAIGSVLALSLSNSVFMPWLGHDWRRVLMVWAAATLASGLVWLAVIAHPAAREMARRVAAAPRRSQREVLLALLRLPAVRLILAMAVGIFLFNHGLNNWLPELLRRSGMSAAQAGYWAAIPTIVGVMASLTIPRLATSERRIAVIVALCLAAAVASLLLHAEAGFVLLGGLIMQGFVRGALMTVAILTLVELRGVGEGNAGTASGLFFSAAEIGGASGPLVIGMLYDATGGFDAGLWLLAGISIALVAATLWLRHLVATSPTSASSAQSTG